MQDDKVWTVITWCKNGNEQTRQGFKEESIARDRFDDALGHYPTVAMYGPDNSSEAQWDNGAFEPPDELSECFEEE